MSSTSRGMAVPNMNDVDVEIVDVIKPRHLRSPVIISSDSEDEILAQNQINNNQNSTFLPQL